MRAPDIDGPVAQAWESRFDPERVKRRDHTATVTQWLVKGPFHPFWSWWSISVVSLRDIPGVPPARKQYPGAEWEFVIVAINPECYPPDPDEEGRLSFLTPVDVVFQFDGVQEADVREIVNLSVRAICDGSLSPDQDYRTIWHAILTRTVAHYKEGRHVAQSQKED